MRKTSRLGLILTCLAMSGPATAKPKATTQNEDLTKKHFASLIAGPEPKTAELTLFFSMMPKGADLHHHYVGALYAEQFLAWVGKLNYCIDKVSYRIEMNAQKVAAQRALPAQQRGCLSSDELFADSKTYQELLQRWSTKDFYNHSSPKAPPDRTFFDTFGYFMPVGMTHTHEGFMTLRERAIQENLSYIETMFDLAPFVAHSDFDKKMIGAKLDDPAFQSQLSAMYETLEKDGALTQKISDYVKLIESSSKGIDDERFTMRYQAYVLRLLSPSQVFSSMYAAYKAAGASPLIVGVNIVGQENDTIAMRDYSMHMRMFQFLSAKHPKVKLALHAGELALGLVPPEGLKFHIHEAIDRAGARRIGHGIDIAHETNAADTFQKMRQRDIAVEINLTSNEFILGIKGAAHPLNLYRKYGVPFVLSTDDAGVSRNNLTNEYVLFASRYRTDYAEVKALAYNSLRYSFLDDKDKQRLIQDLDARFQTFESAIAKMQASAVKL